mgnify:CR=1 FL=1
MNLSREIIKFKIQHIEGPNIMIGHYLTDGDYQIAVTCDDEGFRFSEFNTGHLIKKINIDLITYLMCDDYEKTSKSILYIYKHYVKPIITKNEKEYFEQVEANEKINHEPIYLGKLEDLDISKIDWEDE